MTGMAMGPALHAVIEAPTDAPPFVGDLPARPWPSFVRLFADASPHEISLVVARLSGSGQRGKAPQTVDDLVQSFPIIASGGVAAVDGPVMIAPSCCCGIESWHEWEKLLQDGASPWLGHDPSPWVEITGDDFLVWSDGGLGVGTGPLQSIRFTREQMEAAVNGVERDLRGFAERLGDWGSRVAQGRGQGLVDRFLGLVTLT